MFNRILLFIFFILIQSFSVVAQDEHIELIDLDQKESAFKKYNLYIEPVDVVIPCTEKDLSTLDLCIQGIKNNCNQVNRVIVISKEKLTDKAEWFDESKFPFSKEDVALYLFKMDSARSTEYVNSSNNRVGWYFQQLLKLYAPFCIPNISPNVLVLDSDTIFLNPVKFINGAGEGFLNPGTEHYPPYFEHAKRLIPGLSKIYSQYSGISHHMLLQKIILKDLFRLVKKTHGKPFWKAFCECVDLNHLFIGASEYEIYFNFILARTKQVKLRILKWENVDNLECLQKYKNEGYDYVSCHAWLRH